MTENLTKTEAVGRLISLAKEVEVRDQIDWSQLKVTEEEIYEMMGNSVVDQMYSLPDEHREGVALATMVKLLVENFVLNTKLNEERLKNAPSPDRG
jgi:hypothetical protein